MDTNYDPTYREQGRLALRAPNGLFLGGSLHPNWIGGQRVHAKGYLQITAGPQRGKLAHRAVIEEMLKSPIGLMFRRDGRIPEDMTVHHSDHTRHHNCPGNLMLLQKCIHDAISHDRRRWLDAQNVPEWVDEL